MSATIKYDKIWTVNGYGEIEVNMLWDLATRDGVRSTGGTEDDFYLNLTNGNHIRFVNWNKTGTSQESERKIYIGWSTDKGDTDILIYSNRDSQFDPTNREYCVVYATEGDWSLQVGQGNSTKEDLRGVSPIFAVVKAIDPLTNDETWGIYVPMAHGGYPNAYKNAATKYFATSDTVEDIYNRDANGEMKYVVNENGPRCVLVPMAAVGSKYISKYSQVMMLGNTNEMTIITAGGKSYRLVVNIALPNT